MYVTYERHGLKTTTSVRQLKAEKMLFKLSELGSYVKIRLLLPTFCGWPELSAWKVMFPRNILRESTGRFNSNLGNW